MSKTAPCLKAKVQDLCESGVSGLGLSSASQREKRCVSNEEFECVLENEMCSYSQGGEGEELPPLFLTWIIGLMALKSGRT